jgi:3-phenylpropionate/trans-cinnamate dioxygenase ferredoxin reductase subunit
MSSTSRFVIVGGGQAGGWAAKTLRASGFEGSIVLISDEAHPPYERPPLSKAVLTAAKPPESCYLWSIDKLGELAIDFQRTSTATRVDRARREVLLSDGRAIRYDRLLLTTGARPRRVSCPGADLKGVRYLRSIEDSLDIGANLNADECLVVVGGGWIGLEVAASASSKGVHVTVIEAADRLCGRSLPLSLGKYFLQLHARHGVDVRLNARLESFLGRNGRVEGVLLQDGQVLQCSGAVVGIGVEPNTELAVECGLEVSNGIAVDEHGRTSDPEIFAAGDVANQPFDVASGRMRFESWKNAQDHAIGVAKAMLDQEVPSRDVPWFWSDQYDVNFQMFGLPPAGTDIYQKGDPSTGAFTQYFVTDGLLRAAAAVNGPRDLREAKKAIASREPFSTAGLEALGPMS